MSVVALARNALAACGPLEEQFEDISPKRALVVLAPDEWEGWAEASRMLDFSTDAPFLVIQADADDPAIPVIAGDRPVYLWRDGRLAQR